MDENSKQKTDGGAKVQECKNYRERFIAFVTINDKFIIAISTVCVALFTLTLFIATWLLWWSGERHSERQLRAYVIIDRINIQNIAENQRPVVNIVIKNAGQTPAYDLVFWFKIDSSEYPRPSIFENIRKIITDQLKEAFPSRAVLGPGVEKETSQITTNPLTIEFINQLNAETHAIYAYGEITYRDIFNKKRYTRFRDYRNIRTPTQGNAMTVCAEGNDAN